MFLSFWIERSLSPRTLPPPQWEMKLLPFDEIKASAPPPPPVSAAPPAPTATSSAATPASTDTATAADRKRPLRPHRSKGSPKLPKGVPPPQAANTASGFQRAEAKPPATCVSARNRRNGNGSHRHVPTRNDPRRLVSQRRLPDQRQRQQRRRLAVCAVGGVRQQPRGARSLYNGSVGFMLGNSRSGMRGRSRSPARTRRSRPTTTCRAWRPSAARCRSRRATSNGAEPVSSTISGRATATPRRSRPDADRAERGGDFSQSHRRARPARAVIDPATGAPFAGNVIPRTASARRRGAARLLSAAELRRGFAATTTRCRSWSTTHQDSAPGAPQQPSTTSNQLLGTVCVPAARATTTTTCSASSTRSRRWASTRPRQLDAPLHQFCTFGTAVSSSAGSDQRDAVLREPDERRRATPASRGNNQEPVNWGPPTLIFSSGIAG